MDVARRRNKLGNFIQQLTFCFCLLVSLAVGLPSFAILLASPLLYPSFAGPLVVMFAYCGLMVFVPQIREITLRDCRRPTIVLLAVLQSFLVYAQIKIFQSIDGLKSTNDPDKSVKEEAARKLTNLAHMLHEHYPKLIDGRSGWLRFLRSPAVETYSFDRIELAVVGLYLACMLGLHARVAWHFHRQSLGARCWYAAHIALTTAGMLLAARTVLSPDPPELFPNLVDSFPKVTDFFDKYDWTPFFPWILATLALGLIVCSSVPMLAAKFSQVVRYVTLSVIALATICFLYIAYGIELLRSATGGWVGYPLLLLVVAAAYPIRSNILRGSRLAAVRFFLRDGKIHQTIVGVDYLGIRDVSHTASTKAKPRPCREACGETARSALKHVIVVAEGGGIHAAARATLVLSELHRRTKGEFWKSVRATSGVSGGSIGLAMFAACVEAFPDDPELAAVACQLCARRDLFTLPAARLLMCEAIGYIIPFKSFDRGRGLQLSLEGAVDLAVRDAQVRKDLPPIKSFIGRRLKQFSLGRTPSAMAARGRARDFLRSSILEGSDRGPHMCFNTTSAHFGDRFVLTDLQLAGCRTLGNQYAQYKSKKCEDISIGHAAALSARFPVITAYGSVVLQHENGAILRDRLWDGGIYDNSGLRTAIDLVNELELSSDVLMLVIGNNIDNSESPYEPGYETTNFGELGLLASTAAGTLLDQNSEAGRSFYKLLREDRIGTTQKIHAVDFRWDGKCIQAPLGWYLSGPCFDAIARMHGLNEVARLSPREYELFTELERLTITSNLTSNQLSTIIDFRAHNEEALNAVRDFICGAVEPRRFPDVGQPKAAGITERKKQFGAWFGAFLNRWSAQEAVDPTAVSTRVPGPAQEAAQ